MTASNWQKILKQLNNKPKIKDRFLKHCKPKQRKFGIASRKAKNVADMGLILDNTI